MGTKLIGETVQKIDDPHFAQPVLHAGASLDKARLAVVMVHGRGATAEDILELGSHLDFQDIAYLAPQAAGYTWYPNRFLVETRLNEPHLTSALNKIGAVISSLEKAGFPTERVALLGFSQGASLILEYSARNARRYAAVIGLSGALIGAEGEPRQDAGDLAGTPVFLGCSDIDPHIPKFRVDQSEVILQNLGGKVSKRIYPNMGHTVNNEELEIVHKLLSQ